MSLERALKFVVLIFFASFYLMLFLANYLGLALSLSILPRNLAQNNPTLSLGLFLPFYLPLFSISGKALLGYYFFLVFLLFFAIAFLIFINWRPCLKEIKERRNLLIASHNPLLLISEVFSVIIFITIVYNLLLSTIRVSPTTPDFEAEPIWENMLLLAHASVYEELAVRVVLLALPLMLVHYLGQRKLTIKEFFFGGQKLDLAGVILILISSLIFGFAHALYGWDIYKVFPAFVAGVGFGYVYLKGGIFASIVLHFAFDYMDITYMLAEKNILSQKLELIAVPGILLTGILLLLALGVAPIVMLAYLRKLREGLRRGKRAERVEGGFISLTFPVGTCPKCGSTEARYLEGNILECLRCGERRKMG